MSAQAEASKLTSYTALQSTAAEASKLTSYSVIRQTSADASKLTSYAVIRSWAFASATRMTSYAVLKPQAPESLLMPPAQPLAYTGPSVPSGIDIALIWDDANGRCDFAIDPGTGDLLLDSDGIASAILISLFCDRQAESGDVLPDGTGDPRGWWGDMPLPNASDPTGGADLTGSRLYQLANALRTTDNLRRAEAFVKESLQWGIDDEVFTSVTVTATYPRVPANALFIQGSVALAGIARAVPFAYTIPGSGG